ncbi:uncharacterized protein J8A68_000398 [[Candida] subhashii]|uniref:Uncharacterized protein n=1 Tax=[Candida] subhashii TaxID=561895 RepID=A0A8J5V2B7_9ASCO|nr:uncharacterized protein J8A68_000398 [[Candida] subhashii]KAG7666140.1 hypothetical protein J8A68_000398 [[Candida] subhashii]
MNQQNISTESLDSTTTCKNRSPTKRRDSNYSQSQKERWEETANAKLINKARTPESSIPTPRQIEKWETAAINKSSNIFSPTNSSHSSSSFVLNQINHAQHKENNAVINMRKSLGPKGFKSVSFQSPERVSSTLSSALLVNVAELSVSDQNSPQRSLDRIASSSLHSSQSMEEPILDNHLSSNIKKKSQLDTILETSFEPADSSSSSIYPTIISDDTEQQQSTGIEDSHITKICQVFEIDPRSAKDDETFWEIIANIASNLKESLVLAESRVPSPGCSEELEDKRLEISELKNQITMLRNQYDESCRIAESKDSEFEELVNRFKQKEDELHESRKISENMEGKLEESRMLSKQIAEELVEANKRNQQLSQEVHQVHVEVTMAKQLTEELSQVHQEVDMAKQTFEHYEKFYNSARHMNRCLIKELADTVEVLDAEHTLFVKDRDENHQSIIKLENDLYASKEIQESLKEKYDQAAKKLTATSGQLTESKKLIEAMTKSARQVEEQLARQQKICANKDAKINSFQKALTNVKSKQTKQLQSLENQLDELIEAKNKEITWLKLINKELIMAIRANGGESGDIDADCNDGLSIAGLGDVPDESAHIVIENNLLKIIRERTHYLYSNNMLLFAFESVLRVNCGCMDMVSETETVSYFNLLVEEFKQRKVFLESDAEVLKKVVAIHTVFLTRLSEKYTAYVIKYGDLDE